eukprot:evm.model.scf_392.3 EVM.evm.TU.scf_392.3   scf_392:11745-17274(-)
MTGKWPSAVAPLPPGAIGQIRSGTRIVSMADAVEAVVKNSLDAGAGAIDVMVDPAKGSFTVEDDGAGVPFGSIDALGTWHCTSASQGIRPGNANPGFRGVSLAAIGEVSLLRVVSRARGQFETVAKTIRGGKVLESGVSAEPQGCSGTRVSVRDFLYNRPVRQKLHLCHRSSWRQELEAIKGRLFRLLVPFTSILLALKSPAHTQPMLQLMKVHEERGREASVAKHMFGIYSSHSVAISCQDGSYSIWGQMVLPQVGFPMAKDVQFLYVNKTFVRCSLIVDMISEVFQTIQQMDKKETVCVDEEEGCTGVQKSSFKYPGFLLFIECPALSFCTTAEPGEAHVEFHERRRVLSLAREAIKQAWGSALSHTLLHQVDQLTRKVDYGPASSKVRVHWTESAAPEGILVRQGRLQQNHSGSQAEDSFKAAQPVQGQQDGHVGKVSTHAIFPARGTGIVSSAASSKRASGLAARKSSMVAPTLVSDCRNVGTTSEAAPKGSGGIGSSSVQHHEIEHDPKHLSDHFSAVSAQCPLSNALLEPCGENWPGAAPMQRHHRGNNTHGGVAAEAQETLCDQADVKYQGWLQSCHQKLSKGSNANLGTDACLGAFSCTRSVQHNLGNWNQDNKEGRMSGSCARVGNNRSNGKPTLLRKKEQLSAVHTMPWNCQYISATNADLVKDWHETDRPNKTMVLRIPGQPYRKKQSNSTKWSLNEPCLQLGDEILLDRPNVVMKKTREGPLSATGPRLVIPDAIVEADGNPMRIAKWPCVAEKCSSDDSGATQLGEKDEQLRCRATDLHLENPGTVGSLSQSQEQGRDRKSLVAPTLCLTRAGGHADHIRQPVGTRHSTTVANGNRHRRALSAPPHPKRHCRGFHSNPLCSLHSGQHSIGSQPRCNTMTMASKRGTVTGVQTAVATFSSLGAKQHAKRTVTCAGERLRKLWKDDAVATREVVPSTSPCLGVSLVRPSEGREDGEKQMGDTVGRGTRHCSTKGASSDRRSVHLRLPVAFQSPPEQLHVGYTGAQTSTFEICSHSRSRGDDLLCPMQPCEDEVPFSGKRSIQCADEQQEGIPANPTKDTNVRPGQLGSEDGPDDGWLRCSSSKTLRTPLSNLFNRGFVNNSIPPTATKSLLSADSMGICHGSSNNLVPTTISRAVFDQARILDQVDKKFIILVCGKTVVALDQHAADERVRLESMQHELQALGKGGDTLLDSLSVEPYQAVDLTSLERQMYAEYEQEVWRWGWRGYWDAGRSIFLVTHQPVFLGTPLLCAELKVLLHHLDDTKGSGVLPPGILRLLKSKACRSAIKFGDFLSRQECEELVFRLKTTDFCFHCAHGRPTIAPLINIEAFRRVAGNPLKRHQQSLRHVAFTASALQGKLQALVS